MCYTIKALLLTLLWLPSLQSISVSCTIRDIQKQKVKGGLDQVKFGTLQKYYIGYDYLRRRVYVSVEVRAQDMDKGEKETESAEQWVKEVGVNGDQPGHIIARKLGGPGNENNVFPQSGELNVEKWRSHEDLVYKHLKEGQNRHARLVFAMEYNDQKTQLRPSALLYFYALYENGIVIEKLKGKLDNIKREKRSDQ